MISGFRNSPLHCGKNPAFPLLWLASLCAAAVFILMYDLSHLSADACQYLSTAKNFLLQKGLATSILYYPEHYHIGGVPVPQTCFPNGFPFFIALISLLGLSPEQAAASLAAFSYCCIPLFIYSSLHQAGTAWKTALLTAACWFFFAGPWFTALGLLAEMPFILATVVSIRALQQALKSKRTIWLLIAGGLAAIAFTIRYAGLFFIVSLLLAHVLFEVKNSKDMWRLVSVAFLPVATVFLVFLANYLLVGDFKGGNPQVAVKSLAALLHIFYTALSRLSGFSLLGFREQHLAEMLGLIALILLVSLLLLEKSSQWWRTIRSALRCDFLVRISVLYIIVTSILLGYLELTTSIGLSDRMLFPVIPFFLIAGARLFAARPPQLRSPSSFRSLFVFILATTFIAGQFSAGGIWHREFQEQKEWYAIMHSCLAAPIGTSRRIQEQIQSAASGTQPLLANHSQLLGSLIRQPTLGLSISNYTAKIWTEEHVRDLMASYSSRFVLFFKISQQYDRQNYFFRDLAAGNVPRWLTPVADNQYCQLFIRNE